MSDIVNLAETILANARRLDEYANSRGITNGANGTDDLNGMHGANGSNGTNGTNGTNGISKGIAERETWKSLPPEVETSRTALIDASHKLQHKLRGPGAQIYEHLYRFTDIASWRFICKFDIPSLIPVDGGLTYAAIGEKIKVQESVVRRYLQNAFVSGFFKESAKQPGLVVHTPDSAVLATDKKLLNTIDMLHDEMFPAIVGAIDALIQWPMSQETNESGFSWANNTTDTMYQIFAKDPVRAKRFGAAMSVFTGESKSGAHPFVSGFDWTPLDVPGAEFIDLGGSIGHLSFEVARATKNIKFIVQDLPPTAEAGDDQCPSDMRSRVSFEAYNFLTPQKPREKPVDGIYVANTFQNWPDKYVVQVLRNQIPVLRKGSRVMAMERPLPDKAETNWSERVNRMGDMLMGSLLNGMLRTPAQWEKLFKEADSRFHFIGVQDLGADRSLATAVFE